MENFDKLNFKRNTEVVSRINDNGDLILMKLDDSDSFFKITGISTIIWQELCKDTPLLNNAIDDILKDYNIDKQTLENDISSFIAKLKEKELLL
jgi:hypothetical protein